MRKTVIYFTTLTILLSGIISFQILSNQQSKIYSAGNAEVFTTSLNKKENQIKYMNELTLKNSDVTKELTVTATAYTAHCEGCSGLTTSGDNLIENPELKVIAVDPEIIPLGSKVYVEGYGIATASDTGGAINGHRIDVFFPEKSTAFNWGIRKVKVKILS